MIPQEIFSALSDAHIVAIKGVTGGSINECYHVKLKDNQEYFVKKNEISSMENMFDAEAKGLQLMSKAGAFCPKVIEIKLIGEEQFLILSYHPAKAASQENWSNAGKMLAQMHRHSSEKFGLDHDNYMGSLRQVNDLHDTFQEFFINCRLLPQIQLARDSGALSSNQSRSFDRLFVQIENLIPKEKPSLVHGDLWIGNFHETKDRVMLIDPAVAFSHREIDLAMSSLFGSPPKEFYSGYEEEFPTEGGFTERIEIYNLYPLLIHLNLFGVSYLSGIESTLKKHT
jgi:fructosamine-3-kinase